MCRGRSGGINPINPSGGTVVCIVCRSLLLLALEENADDTLEVHPSTTTRVTSAKTHRASMRRRNLCDLCEWFPVVDPPGLDPRLLVDDGSFWGSSEKEPVALTVWRRVRARAPFALLDASRYNPPRYLYACSPRCGSRAETRTASPRHTRGAVVARAVRATGSFFVLATVWVWPRRAAGMA